MCFLSLPPSITVVSEKDNLLNNNNKNYKYDTTIDEQNRTIDEQNLTMVEQNRTMDEQNRTMDEQNRTIDEQNRTIDDQNGTIDEQLQVCTFQCPRHEGTAVWHSFWAIRVYNWSHKWWLNAINYTYMALPKHCIRVRGLFVTCVFLARMGRFYLSLVEYDWYFISL